jgi:hypothetical protein
MEEFSESYKSRCLKQLKEWNAPLSGWYCIHMIDTENDEATCELCGCHKVRFIHVMRHDDFFDDVQVGCICAGIMEDNILAAKDRERQLENRAKRKHNFPNRKWKTAINGNKYLAYKGLRLFINHNSSGLYTVKYGEQVTYVYKGKLIKDELSAKYAAFDMVDPA